MNSPESTDGLYSCDPGQPNLQFLPMSCCGASGFSLAFRLFGWNIISLKLPSGTYFSGKLDHVLLRSLFLPHCSCNLETLSGPEVTQTHVHRVSDAIQPSHPLSSPSQHQSLFQRVSYLHEVAKVLELQLYHQSFQ